MTQTVDSLRDTQPNGHNSRRVHAGFLDGCDEIAINPAWTRG